MSTAEDRPDGPSPGGMAPDLAEVERAVQRTGLTPRGAFHPEPGDGVPNLKPSLPSGAVVLVGHAGPEMWQAFSHRRGNAEDPLDDWSRQVVGELADRLGAAALFPFERPYLPFQRWGQKAEPCHVSPLGILIHPDCGLWHGYRGALAFAERFDLPAADTRPSPCASCADKPCLATCPVAAFGAAGYDVPACVAHLTGDDGRDCMKEGCRARRACPAGRTYRYEAAQAAFHMEAFLSRRLQEAAKSPARGRGESWEI